MSKGEGAFMRRVLAIVRSSQCIESLEFIGPDGQLMDLLPDDYAYGWELPWGAWRHESAILLGDLRVALFDTRTPSWGDSLNLSAALTALERHNRVRIFPVVIDHSINRKGRRGKLVQYHRYKPLSGIGY